MKKKNNRRLTALVISSLAVIHAQSAIAASLNVKIRQLNPAGETHAITCIQKKRCELPFTIKTAQAKNETLTVHVDFSEPTVLFEFRTPDGYLYAGDRNPVDKQNAIYQAIWHRLFDKDKASTFNVTLFLPAVPNSITAMILNSVQEPVADLEITVEATP